ncbi:MAG: protein kinase [Myxococcales bacterium]|nr:protein kinase [Myxococcales bacterium]
MSGARRLGRYEVGERLGSGGLGEVYLAHVEGARGFRKRVVIKQIRRELAARPEVASLLRAEAEVVQRLAHGNIVQVLDFGVEDGQAYVVMEHVDGASLAALLADAGARAQLDAAAALFVVEAVCAALAHAHAQPGLVHRDVTPANILVSRDGVVKLTDFGIASLIATTADAGTPGYAAPEQRAGRAVDARADVYALGVVLGELVAGEDEALRAIARRASSPEREDRFASAEALAAALERWRAERGILRAAPGLALAVRGLQARSARLADGVGASLARRGREAVTAALAPARPRRARWVGLAGGALGLGALAWAAVTLAGAAGTATREAAGEAANGSAASVAAGRLDERAGDAALGGAPTSEAGATIGAPFGDADAKGDAPASAAGATIGTLVSDADAKVDAPASAAGATIGAPSGDADAKGDAPASEATGGVLASDAAADVGAPASDARASDAGVGLGAGEQPAISGGEKSKLKTIKHSRREKGRLLLNLVPWAEASVDGRVLGRTPLAVDLAAGRYTMELVNPELGQRRTRTIIINGGGETRVTDW